MKTYVVTAKNDVESKLLQDAFKKNNIQYKLIDLEEFEDMLFLEKMKEGEKTEFVSRSSILKKLKRPHENQI